MTFFVVYYYHRVGIQHPSRVSNIKMVHSISKLLTLVDEAREKELLITVYSGTCELDWS